MADPFFITTAIDYTNAPPHIGHAYEKILADVLARYHRLKGEDVYFLTGVDQHGQKVQQAAQADGKNPQAYCDAQHRNVFDSRGTNDLSSNINDCSDTDRACLAGSRPTK